MSPHLLESSINEFQVTSIMLSHLCAEEYHPFSKTIACLCIQLLHALIQLKWHRDGTLAWDPALEDLMLYEAFGLLMFSYVHLVISMVSEVSRALGIYAFTITKKRPSLPTKRA